MENFFNKKLTLHLLIWLAFGTFGGLVFAAFFPLKIVLAHVAGNLCLLALLFYGTAVLVNRFVENGKNWQAAGWSALLFAVVSGLRTWLNFQLLLQFPVEKTAADPVFSPLLRVGALVLATSAFVQLLAISFQLLTNRYLRERQTRQLLEQQQAAQLDFLKEQINPHFLFNALNNIYSLTVLRSPDAPKMLLKLSDLLRYSIYEGRKRAVAVADELRHIQNFIELFQMRNEQPANIEFEISGDFSAAEIEPMILIPIVENCFKHADFETNPQSFAKISLHAEPRKLIFQTSNSFDSANRQKDETGGVGLENIARRLELRYGSAAHRFDFQAVAGVFELVLEIHF